MLSRYEYIVLHQRLHSLILTTNLNLHRVIQRSPLQLLHLTSHSSRKQESIPAYFWYLAQNQRYLFLKVHTQKSVSLIKYQEFQLF